jgi:YebC/PmpR family DNA-binding regulatory protein
MSGHSKWATIKRKKDVTDSKRGKVFTQHAKLIAIAAQQGGDPEMNPGLRVAIDRAKEDNLPNANIERAIKKGTGELKDGNALEEITYEGYASGGVALLIHTITDNRNRTVSNLRNHFTKHGGNLGESGCTAWMFQKRGVIVVDLNGKNAEEAELAIIEAGAEDMSVSGNAVEVITPFEKLMAVKKTLEAQGFKIESADVAFLPKEKMAVQEEELAGKVLRLIDVLEEDEDVTQVSSNVDIPEALMEKMA